MATQHFCQFLKKRNAKKASGADKVNKTLNGRCHHGMINAYCAICLGIPLHFDDHERPSRSVPVGNSRFLNIPAYQLDPETIERLRRLSA